MIEPIQAVARELGVHVCFGTYERGPERGVVYNSSVLIGPSGDLLGIYRKTHPFCSEIVSGGGWVTPGDTVTVCDTELGRIGMIICFDGDYPELSRIQAVQGAEVICRPSALLRSADIWDLTSRARAYDNHVYVIGANAVGADPAGVLYFGNSHIVTPIGHIVAKAATHPGWVTARLDPADALVVPDARAPTSARPSTTCATATSTSSATTGPSSRAPPRRRSRTPRSTAATPADRTTADRRPLVDVARRPGVSAGVSRLTRTNGRPAARGSGRASARREADFDLPVRHRPHRGEQQCHDDPDDQDDEAGGVAPQDEDQGADGHDRTGRRPCVLGHRRADRAVAERVPGTAPGPGGAAGAAADGGPLAEQDGDEGHDQGEDEDRAGCRRGGTASRCRRCRPTPAA